MRIRRSGGPTAREGKDSEWQLEGNPRSIGSSSETLSSEQNSLRMPISQVQRLRLGGTEEQARSPPLSEVAELRSTLTPSVLAPTHRWPFFGQAGPGSRSQRVSPGEG